MKRGSLWSAAVILSSFLSLNFVQTAYCALTPKELETKIKEAKILQPGDRISSAIHNDEVTIHKFKAADSQDTEKDCKIEAVLLGRVVFTADPTIKKVRVRFFERNQSANYSEVVVQPIHIKSFASGAISQEDLLSSLELTHGVDAAAASKASVQNASTTDNTTAAKPDDGIQGVSDGPLKDQRADLLARIRKLHEQNVNTKAFTEQFLQLDKFAAEGNSSATLESFDKLDFHVKEQQKALDRKGQPVYSAKSGAATESSSTAGSGSSGTAEGGGMLSGLTLGDLMNMDPQKLAYTMAKKRYGVFTPVPGPYQEERNYISSVLIRRQQSGYPVKQFEGMAKGLNDAASVNDLATLRSRIKNAYAYLQIPSYQQYMMSRGGGWHH